MVFNNGAVVVEQSGDAVVIEGKLADLHEFASSDANQGSAKWIGLDIATDLDTIVGATWGGSYTMTAADAEEAAGLGLGDGHIVFWVKAEQLANAPYSISIGAEGKEPAQLSVAFEEQA